MHPSTSNNEFLEDVTIKKEIDALENDDNNDNTEVASNISIENESNQRYLDMEIEPNTENTIEEVNNIEF